MKKLRKKLYQVLISKKIFFVYYILILIRRFFCLKKKINFCKEKKKLKIIGKHNYDFFLGYYDINNISEDETKILFHKKNKKSNKVDLCIYDVLSQLEKKIDESYAWSWQLGTRLQWVDHQSIIYNYVQQNSLCSIILNLQNNKKKILNYPIFSKSNNNKYYLNLNFQRLETTRKGYGYCFNDNTINLKNYIRIIDLNENKIIKIYDEIFFYNQLKKEIYQDFYFNHLSWSPNSKHFVVYLICSKTRSNKLIFFTDFDQCKVIPNIKNISHHTWIDDTSILFFGEINNCKNFYIFNLKDFNYKKLEFVNSNQDGHPYSLDGNKFIIDTYPDKFHTRKLYTYDLKNDLYEPILNVFSNPYLINSQKCDLHPKISKQQNIIAFDTSHNKRREIVLLQK